MTLYAKTPETEISHEVARLLSALSLIAHRSENNDNITDVEAFATSILENCDLVVDEEAFEVAAAEVIEEEHDQRVEVIGDVIELMHARGQVEAVLEDGEIVLYPTQRVSEDPDEGGEDEESDDVALYVVSYEFED